MKTRPDKTNKHKNQSAANNIVQGKGIHESTFPFIDKRPETVAQRKLSLLVNKQASLSVSGTNTDYPNTIQRAIKQDPGAGQSKEWYAKQIEATKTETQIQNLVLSGMKSTDGVFISDNADDWSQQQWVGQNLVINKLVLPNYDELARDPTKFPASIQNNGQSVKQNCEIIAEHELTHLKHVSENSKKKNGKGAQTTLGKFNDANIQNTVDDLLQKLNNIYVSDGTNTIIRLKDRQDFVKERLDYIIDTWKKGRGNVEAPTVLRELRRYLDNVVTDKDGDTWKNFQKEIKTLDDECSELVGIKIKEGCYITTACVESMGLDDDCTELKVLRKFRDQYLKNKINGEQLIQLYYQHAPSILQAIRKREEEEEIFKHLYTVISQCVAAIQHGEHEFAFQKYCEMVKKLSQEFIPEIYKDLEFSL